MPHADQSSSSVHAAQASRPITPEEEEELRALMKLERDGPASSMAGQPWHVDEPIRHGPPLRSELEYTPAEPAPPAGPGPAVPPDMDWSKAAPNPKGKVPGVDGPEPRMTDQERGFAEIGENDNLDSLHELDAANKAIEAERREAEMVALEALGWGLAAVEPGPGGEAYMASRAGGKAASAAAGQAGKQVGKRLFWHGSPKAVAKREAEGVFTDGAGNGGLNWATDRTRDELGPMAWRVGGNHDVKFRPPFLVNKGGLDATYELSPAEVEKFRRAWGADFNWNAYQWYKGASGQYYYRPNPATAGQRVKELSQAAGITAAGAGIGYGIARPSE